jgi:hypothetical protein
MSKLPFETAECLCSSELKKPLPLLRGKFFSVFSLQTKDFPELLNSLPVLLAALPRRNRYLELRLFHSRREGFDVGACGNSSQRAQALLRGLGQKKIDK